MGTTAEKLTYLNETKTQLKDMLNLGGASLTTEPFRQYVDTLKNRYLYFMNNGTQQVWDNWEKVVGEGTTITLNNTEEAPMKIVYKGNTLQNGTPTPTTPIPVQVVSGDNSINVVGKNLLDSSTFMAGSYQGIDTTTKLHTSQALLLESNTYTISTNLDMSTYKFYMVTGSTQVPFQTAKYNSGWVTNQQYSFTLGDSNKGYFCLCIGKVNNGTLTVDDIKDYHFQLEKGSTATTYTPYESNSYPISLSSNLLYNESLPKVQASVIADYVQGIFSLKGTSSGASNLYIIPYATSMTHIEAGESITFYIERVSGTSVVKFMTYFTPDDGTSPDYTWGVTLNANASSNKVVKTATKAGTLKNVQFFIDSGVAYDSEVKILVKKGNIENPVWQPYMTPIELCKIGTYQDKIDKSSGKNLFDNSKAQIGKAWNNASNTARAIVITKAQPNTTYTISYLNKSAVDDIYWFDRENENDSTYITGNTQITQTTTITTKPNANYIGIQFNKTSITQADIDKVGIMLNEGTTALPYEPYGTSWYVKKEIGKKTYVGDSGEGWVYQNTYPRFFIEENTANSQTTRTPIVSNYFIYLSSGEADYGVFCYQSKFFLYEKDITSVNDLKTWLSTHNTTVYYVLATPTYTEITDSTLISQLNALAKSYASQTNISQENNDLASILNATALEEMS